MSLLLHQLRSEQRLYWRSHELAFFTFIFPLLIYILLGSVYGDDPVEGEGVTGSAYLLAGHARVRRGRDGVRRTRDPRRHPPRVGRAETGEGDTAACVGLCLALLGSTLVVFVIEAVALILLAKLMFDVPFPDQPVSVALALLLGAARSRRSAWR